MGQRALGGSRSTVDPDAKLVEALRRQEPEATEALIALYGDRVYRFAVRITGTQHDAEEAVQDALLSVVRKIDTFSSCRRIGQSPDGQGKTNSPGA